MIRVLLIEDNKSVRSVLEHGLPGISFTHADTVSLGLALLRDGTFDAVLLDVFMPSASLNNTINHLPEMRAISQIPIVMLSGSADAEDIDRAIAAGANAYLTKDLLPHAIVQVFITLYVTLKKAGL